MPTRHVLILVDLQSLQGRRWIHSKNCRHWLYPWTRWDFFIRSWPLQLSLVVLHTITEILFPLVVHGTFSEIVIGIERKSNLIWFTKGQTQFSTSWHAKMSLNINEPIENVLCSNLHTTSNYAPKTYRTWKVLYATKQLPTRKSCWVRG